MSRSPGPSSTSPAIVFADEPTGNLDTESATQIIGLIQRLNSEYGQAFVIVTHSPEIAAKAQRIIRMRDGQIIADEPVHSKPRLTAFSGFDVAAGE